MDMKPDQSSAITDSQQHLVEVSTRRRYFERWTKSEKIFALVIVILLILFLTFFTLYLALQHCRKEGICMSKECLRSSAILLHTANFSQNPCDDFYNFACGKFGKDYPLVLGYGHNSWFKRKELSLTRRIQRVLEEPNKSSDLNCVKGAKLLYRSCANGNELNRFGLHPLFELLELVELPKTIPINEEPKDFNLGRALALAHRHLSHDILVAVNAERVGQNNITVQNTTVLRFSPAIGGISVFRNWKYQRNLLPDFNEVFGSWIIGNKFQWNNIKNLSPHDILLAAITFMTEIFREILRGLDQSDNFNSTEMVSVAYEMINFYADLDWKNPNIDSNPDDGGRQDYLLTLPKLQEILDKESNTNSLTQKIDWKEYVSVLFENSNVNFSAETDVVIVQNMEYFKYLAKTLGDAEPIDIWRHVWWKVVEEFGKYTTSTMRRIYGKYSRSFYEEGIGSARTGACTYIVRQFMGIALSHQMAKKDNFSSAIVGVRKILKDVEHAFGTTVNSTPWMDSTTKKMILDKVYSVKDQMGYPEWLFDEYTVDTYHEGLDLQKSEFLKNIMRIKEWEFEKMLMNLGPDKEVGNGTRVTWFGNALQVNAYYSRIDNLITVPPGLLQTPFYFRGLPSLNYGAIGSILGHELTHAFDTEGRNYNKYGAKIEQPWPKGTNMEYEKRAKCFVDQYGAYDLDENNKLNGTVTLAENIADNGGVRASIRAYKLFKERHGEQLKLPGFEEFTDEQLLFLSYANIWCEEADSKYRMHIKDTHSPNGIRVLASLKNLKEFAEIYNCPSGSNMNPKDKCIIW